VEIVLEKRKSQMKKVFVLFVSVLLTLCFVGWTPSQGPETRPGGMWELPIEGASGYAAIELILYGSGDKGPIGKLSAGQGFTVLRESEEWWYIQTEEMPGWVMHKYCLINLPDIIPSIVYNNTNTYSSLLKSSGKDIPGVTGTALYQAKDFSNRLSKEEYIVPTMYGMATKIYAAQQSALADGNTLVIYEAFRPADAHQKVYDNLKKLVGSDPEVWAGVTGNTFTMGWFLAPAPYNHQRGTAIDVSLAKIGKKEQKNAGDYEYIEIAEYVEYPMQSAIHELSKASAIFTTTVAAHSETAWKSATPSGNITEGSLLLQKYCTDAGLTPLASEWWHFNDIRQTDVSVAMENTGRYSIESSFSAPPTASKPISD
jgi:D-alanyl-D-alanine dipeptidase